MQKTLAAAAIATLVGVAGAAHAADFYAPGGFKDGPVAPCPTCWAGYYFGGHVGGAWGTLDVTDQTSVPNVKFDHDASSVFGGGQVGFNYQRGNLVVGPEIDVGGMGLSNTKTEIGGAGAISKLGSGYYLDITGRLGYAFGPALIYGKGGYALYGGDASVTEPSTPATVKRDGISGFTAGGGVEYQINPAWSIKAEYLFFDFGNAGGQLVFSNTTGDSYSSQLTVQTAKVGINFHIPSFYEPLK